MSEWMEALDKYTGKVYYVNTVLKSTQWEKPDVLVQEEKRNHPSEWREAEDPNTGRTYYCNTRTRRTTWTRPACLDSDDDEEEEVVQDYESDDDSVSQKEEEKTEPDVIEKPKAEIQETVQLSILDAKEEVAKPKEQTSNRVRSLRAAFEQSGGAAGQPVSQPRASFKKKPSKEKVTKDSPMMPTKSKPKEVLGMDVIKEAVPLEEGAQDRTEKESIPEDAAIAVDVNHPTQWEKQTDPYTQQVYYRHRVTGEQAWMKPDGWDEYYKKDVEKEAERIKKKTARSFSLRDFRKKDKTKMVEIRKKEIRQKGLQSVKSESSLFKDRNGNLSPEAPKSKKMRRKTSFQSEELCPECDSKDVVEFDNVDGARKANLWGQTTKVCRECGWELTKAFGKLQV